jgi:hypothetical protein
VTNSLERFDVEDADARIERASDEPLFHKQASLAIDRLFKD